jgi:hypothetical protein
VVEAKIQLVSAIAGAVSAALGFVAPWPHVVTGLFFSLAGGFAGMAVSPSSARLNLIATLFVALVIGTFAGLAHPHLGSLPVVGFMGDLPIQLVMGAGGLCSRWITFRLASGELPFLKGGK